MADSGTKATWQDWTLLGMRLVFVAGIILAELIFRLQSELESVGYSDLAIAGGIGLAAAAIYAGILLIPNLTTGYPYLVMIGDAILTGVFILLTDANPVIVVGIIAALSVSALLRFGMLWGGGDSAGIIAVSLAMVAYANDLDNIDPTLLLKTYAVTYIVALMLVCVGALWSYVRQERLLNEFKFLRENAASQDKRVQNMRERTRTMAKMTVAISSTLNYQKILDSALDIGRVSLRSDAKAKIISMVMLFRSYDDALYIVNSRGLTHIDEAKVVHGQDGIVAKCLRDCAPVIGKDAFRDPELKAINAFQGVRSILVIPLRAHFDNYGVLIYGSSAPNAFNEDHTDALQAIGVQATVALQNAVLYDNLVREKDRIIEMEEDARKALVRDLHDIPAQTIQSVVMRIRIIQRQLERAPQDVPAELKSVEEMAMQATDEIRHVLFKLRPLALETQGLGAALQQLAEKVEKTYGQPVAVRIAPEVEMFLDENKQGALFYLIEEAVNNARKYAQAELIRVAAGVQNGSIIVQITDNGVGFDPNTKKDDGRDHFGVINMTERAELIDGALELASAPGKGTKITVLIPIDSTDPTMRKRTAKLRARMPDTKLALSAMQNFDEITERP
jgi:signal transduction histidine kinase